MEISNVNVTPVTTNAEMKTKTAENPIENTPKKEVDPDGNKKIFAGLTALGAIALAGIGIARHNKKATKEAEVIMKSATEEVAKEAAKKAEDEAAKKAAKKAEELAKEAAKKAEDELAKEAAKKAAKENSQNIEKVASLAKKNEGLKQGIKSQDLDGLIERIDTAKANAEKAEELAKQISDYAEFNNTKQNKKRAKIAQSQARKARLKADNIITGADKRVEELVQQSDNKKIHRAEQQASPNYEVGKAKQKENQAVTDKNAVIRKASNKTQKPAYQRAVANFKRRHISDSKEGLERVINSNKFSETEKEVAKDLLEAMKK